MERASEHRQERGAKMRGAGEGRTAALVIEEVEEGPARLARHALLVDLPPPPWPSGFASRVGSCEGFLVTVP